jgi:hypothetical protein
VVRCWFLRFFVDSVVMCLLVDWVERLPWKFKTFPVRGLPSSAWSKTHSSPRVHCCAFCIIEFGS